MTPKFYNNEGIRKKNYVQDQDYRDNAEKIHLSFNPLLHDLFFSSVFWDIALDRLLSSTNS